MKREKKDFNHLKEWMQPLLKEKNLSIEMFSREVGLTRAAVYNYMVDRNRPTEETMIKICRVLERPLEEGLQQYTPRPIGRPAVG